MKDENTTQDEHDNTKSWLEEQLQKRNFIHNDENQTFNFKDDNDKQKIEHQQTQKPQNQITENITQSLNSIIPQNHKTEQNINTQNDLSTPKIHTDNSKKSWQQKIKEIGEIDLARGITVKKSIPYLITGVVLIFLLTKIQNLLFDEGEIQPLHNVNVKDTLLSDVSITKTLDPNRSELDEKKTKKQNKTNTENKIEDKKDPAQTLSQRIYYKVKPGDKFNDIARKHGLTPAELKELNPKVRPDRIQPGQKLRVKKLD
ncbi:MAG: LysM peptidoglycan-binding domain-containing protein [Bacteroidia bacterium]|nr:LysM peptidoglycan-binding domain-containing protein [Bacteroidia bacterium]MDW8347256.1 LysM domain-containing protein [Bacteroidia bacterium]